MSSYLSILLFVLPPNCTLKYISWYGFYFFIREIKLDSYVCLFFLNKFWIGMMSSTKCIIPAPYKQNLTHNPPLNKKTFSSVTNNMHENYKYPEQHANSPPLQRSAPLQMSVLRRFGLNRFHYAMNIKVFSRYFNSTFLYGISNSVDVPTFRKKCIMSFKMMLLLLKNVFCEVIHSTVLLSYFNSTSL